MIQIPSPDDFRFSIPITIRFRDMDAYGHVNNAVFFTFFEMARTGYAEEVFGFNLDDGKASDLFPFILANVEANFISPARIGEKLQIHMRTTKIGKKSFEFDYLVVNADSGTPVATGHSVQVFYDYNKDRSMEAPEHLRNAIEDYEGHK